MSRCGEESFASSACMRRPRACVWDWRRGMREVEVTDWRAEGIVFVERACVVERRVVRFCEREGMARCRKEGFVVGFWIRARERAVVWRVRDTRTDRSGRRVGRSDKGGVERRSAVVSASSGCARTAGRRKRRSRSASGSLSSGTPVVIAEVRRCRFAVLRRWPRSSWRRVR